MSTLPIRRERPVLVTMYAIGVLILSIVFLAGGLKTLQIWSHPDRTIPQIPLVYAIFRNLLFGFGGCFLVWGLLTARYWSPGWTLGLVIFYWFTYWLELILVVDEDIRSGNLTFLACVSIVTILISWLVLWVYPGSRTYFRRDA